MEKKISNMIIGMVLAGILVGCGAAADDGTPPRTETESQAESEMEMNTQMETESEVVQEPVITTVTISATGDCALGALQYHEYSGSFHSYWSCGYNPSDPVLFWRRPYWWRIPLDHLYISLYRTCVKW